jgi:lipopolysaccharide export system permease protein
MNLLSRYIGKTTILATLLIMLIFAGLLFFMGFLTELKNIGEGDYDIWQVLLYSVFSLPSKLYQFSPLCLLLGSVMGVGALSSHKELTMMRVAGFSLRQIIISVLASAGFLVLIGGILGEGAAPMLSYMAEIKKENARNGGQAVVTGNGVWFHVDNNFIHVKNVIDRHRLEGVTRYQFDEAQKLKAAYFAEQLTLKNHTWSADQVVKTAFYKDRTKSESLSASTWDIIFNPNLLNAGLLEAEEMSLSRLYRFIHYLKQNRLQSSEYEYEFWQRVFRPLASLLMIFLALPFVIGLLNKAALGRRILFAILIGFSFFIVNALLAQLSIVFQLPAFYAALFPLLLFALLGYFLVNILNIRP